MPLSAVEQHLLQSIDPDEVIAFLQGLVRIRSHYPPGDCTEAAAFCAAKFASSGIEHKVVADLPERPSVLATLPGRQRRPQLAFNAHIDTVPIEYEDAWDYDPFGGQLVDGKIYGRGAGDDKGSVAAQVMAAVAIARSGVKLNGTLIVNPVADEESMSAHGAQWLHDSGQLQPDMLIVGEQTENQIAVAERAVTWFELTVYGEAAHGAMPWNGHNAIRQMADVIKYLEAEYWPLLEQRTHPLLPPSTMNLGTISGGLKTNMVPEMCRITLDRRIIPGETTASALAELEQVLQRYSNTVQPLRYELNALVRSLAPLSTEPDHPLVKVMQSAIRDAGNGEPLVTGYNQASDGRFFAEDGIPVLIYGPSNPDLGHAANEHVSVDQLIEATRVYALTAVRALGIADDT